MTKRIYDEKDVEMLIGSKVVCVNAKEHHSEISILRADWTNISFFTNLETRVDNAITTYLGVDPAKLMRETTQSVVAIQASTEKNLAMLKLQLELDYEKEPTKLANYLKIFGFTQHWKDVLKRDQEATVEMIEKIKKNYTPAVQAEFASKGMNTALMTYMLTQAQPLMGANVSQETQKAQRVAITNAAVTEFNAIFTEIMKICKIAAKFYGNKPEIKRKFVFSKIVSNMNTYNTPKEDDEPTV